MATAHEEDVVIAFRQAVEEEMQRALAGEEPREELMGADISPEETLRRLIGRHEELEREVALLRTILLRLVSEPVDQSAKE